MLKTASHDAIAKCTMSRLLYAINILESVRYRVWHVVLGRNDTPQKNRGRVNHFHARWCVSDAWHTASELGILNSAFALPHGHDNAV